MTLLGPCPKAIIKASSKRWGVTQRIVIAKEIGMKEGDFQFMYGKNRISHIILKTHVFDKLIRKLYRYENQENK